MHTIFPHLSTGKALGAHSNESSQEPRSGPQYHSSLRGSRGLWNEVQTIVSLLNVPGETGHGKECLGDCEELLNWRSK